MEDLVKEKAQSMLKEIIRLDKLKNLAEREKDSEDWKEKKKVLSWNYPFYQETIQKGKYTVSELKKLSMSSDEEEELFVFQEVEDEIPSPSFLSGKEKIEATKRGTLIHKLYELIDFQNINSVKELEKSTMELISAEKIPKEILNCTNFNNLYHIFDTELGKRMKAADAKGRLYKEAQFMIGMPMSEINHEMDYQEMVLVQGIIDLYFEEDDGLVLVDYKTDRAKGKSGEERLVHLYREQLSYYKKTLEQLTGKRVKESYIYSLALEKEIRVDL